VDGKLEGIAHVHVTILGIEIILLTSLKIRQGLKLRVCFSKVDKSWVGDFNWALPPLAIQPFFHHDHRFEQGFLLIKLVAVSFAAR